MRSGGGGVGRSSSAGSRRGRDDLLLLLLLRAWRQWRTHYGRNGRLTSAADLLLRYSIVSAASLRNAIPFTRLYALISAILPVPSLLRCFCCAAADDEDDEEDEEEGSADGGGDGAEAREVAARPRESATGARELAAEARGVGDGKSAEESDSSSSLSPWLLLIRLGACWCSVSLWTRRPSSSKKRRLLAKRVAMERREGERVEMTRRSVACLTHHILVASQAYGLYSASPYLAEGQRMMSVTCTVYAHHRSSLSLESSLMTFFVTKLEVELPVQR